VESGGPGLSKKLPERGGSAGDEI